MVGDPLHIIQEVGREEDRALAAAGEVDHGLEQGPAGGGVQAGGRIVEHQHLRLDRQRHRQVEAGALAVRQVPGLGARVDREVVDHGGEDFLVPVIVEAALKSPVLADPHPAVDGMSLGHVTDPGAGFGTEGGAVAAEDDRRAARRLQEAQEHADGCRLAGSVAADECEDAAARHAEGDAVDRASSPEVARQPAQPRSPSHTGRVGWCGQKDLLRSCFSPIGLVSQSSSVSFSSTTLRISSALKSRKTASWMKSSTASRNRRKRSALL